MYILPAFLQKPKFLRRVNLSAKLFNQWKKKFIWEDVNTSILIIIGSKNKSAYIVKKKKDWLAELYFFEAI